MITSVSDTPSRTADTPHVAVPQQSTRPTAEPATCPAWCSHHAWDDIEFHVGEHAEVQLGDDGYVAIVRSQPVDGSDPGIFLEVSDGTPGRRPAFVDVPAEQWSHLLAAAIR